MPELPEVETVARQLVPHVVGRVVRQFRIHDPLLRTAPTPALRGRRILDVRRSGKRVLFALDGGPRRRAPLWLAVHLRMTGRLLWSAQSVARDHLRARFALDRGELVFVDTRRFGTFHWFSSADEARPDGVDPLSRGLTPLRFHALIGDTRQSLKAWLLRQDRLVGLGNIYASEILHDAGLCPLRVASSLDADERRRLLRSTRRILRRAIRACGTTFSDFQGARGVEGSYQRYLAVYGRAEQPCGNCGEPIRRVVQHQRSTFYCPRCQTS